MFLINNIIVILLIVLLPRVLVLLSKKVSILNTLGPVFLCYAAGFIFSLLLPDTSIAMDISEILVPIAIPLILFSADLRSVKHLAKPTLISFALMMLAVMAVSSCVFLLFRNTIPNAEKYAGMMIGLYTGGTPNLMAIGAALKVAPQHIVLANTADVVVGGIYFLLLISVMPKLCRRFLPAFNGGTSTDAPVQLEQNLEASFIPEKDVFSFRLILKRVPIVLLGVLCLGTAAGLALLITGELDVMIIMLVVTTLGIGLSFISKVRQAPGSYSAGQYLIYMFSVGIGLSFDFSAINLNSLLFLCMFASAQFGSVILHLLLARIARIDADTAIITSTAGIYGPAFIVPTANALNNRQVVLPGLICGILGYAVGNYLGIGVALLLGMIP